MCAMLLPTQPYKGTRDFYPDEMRLRNWFFGTIRSTLETAAFDEYDGPMLESLELYAAKAVRKSPTSKPIILLTEAAAPWQSALK